MSHNLTTVNNQSSDINGAVTQSLNNLNNTSASSPSTNDMVVYNGSLWTNTADALTPNSARLTAGSTSSASSVLIATPNPYIGATDPNRFFWDYAAIQISTTIMIDKFTTADVSIRTNNYGALTKWAVGFDFNTAGVYALKALLHIGALSASTSYIDCS